VYSKKLDSNKSAVISILCFVRPIKKNKIIGIIQGGPAKVRPTYIFDGNILMHRKNSINFGTCHNSN